MKRDFLFTFKDIFIKNIFIGVIFLSINVLTISNVNSNNKLNDINLIFQSLKGVPYYKLNEGFQLPLIWFIINFFIIFNLANYIYDDFRDNGKYILIKVKKMKYFYFTKVLWLIYNIFIYYIILFLIMIIISKMFLYESSKYILIEGIYMDKYTLTIKLFLLYYTTSVALVLLQNTIALVLEPVYSYLVILLLIVISVFTINNLLPGQHSLILRHIPFDNIHRLTFAKSLVYNFVLSIFSIMMGYLILLKKDVL